MSETESIPSLLSTLNWMEEVTAVQWPAADDRTPDELDAYSLEARHYVAVVAKDEKNFELIDSLCSPVFEIPVSWLSGVPIAWLNAANVACMTARSFALVALGTRPGADTAEEKLDYAKRAYNEVIPMVDALLESENCLTSLGEERILDCWGDAHAIVAWAARGNSPQIAQDLLEKLLSKARVFQPVPSVLEAISFAIDSALTINDESGDPKTQKSGALNLIDAALETFVVNDQALPDEDDSWRVSAVGILARLISELDAKNLDLLWERLLAIQSLWSENCYFHQNSDWAVSWVFVAIRKSFEANGLQLNENKLELIERITRQKTRIVTQILWGQKSFCKNLDSLYSKPFCESIVDDIQSSISEQDFDQDFCYSISALRLFSDRLEASYITQVWSTISQRPPPAQLVWLSDLSYCELESWRPQALSTHLMKLIEMPHQAPEAYKDKIREAWLNALVVIASVAFLKKDIITLDDCLQRLFKKPDCDVEAWYTIVSIAALGLGKHENERVSNWAQQALDLLERTSSQDTVTQAEVCALTTLMGELNSMAPKLSHQLGIALEQRMERQNISTEENT